MFRKTKAYLLVLGIMAIVCLVVVLFIGPTTPVVTQTDTLNFSKSLWLRGDWVMIKLSDKGRNLAFYWVYKGDEIK